MQVVQNGEILMLDAHINGKVRLIWCALRDRALDVVHEMVEATSDWAALDTMIELFPQTEDLPLVLIEFEQPYNPSEIVAPSPEEIHAKLQSLRAA